MTLNFCTYAHADDDDGGNNPQPAPSVQPGDDNGGDNQTPPDVQPGDDNGGNNNGGNNNGGDNNGGDNNGGDNNNQPTPSWLQPGSALCYQGDADGVTVTMTIDYNTLNGDEVRGTMTVNGKDYPFVMDLVDNDFQGTLITPNQRIAFTGSSDGTTMMLDIQNMQFTLSPTA
jgi:hypothetical protein